MAPKTMRAIVVRRFGQPPQLEELPVPEPAAGQVLVQVIASGVCHTDLHAADGDWPVKPKLPFVPGHEGVGLVARVGSGVADLREGDRVGVPWLHSACGVCEHCVGGWETLCPRQENTGYSVDGGFAEYVLARASHVGRIPDEVSFADAAPVLCAGVTTYKGLKQADVRPGEWIVVSGIGGLGHLAVQYAVAMGMKVVAVDVNAEALQLAQRLGATHTIDARRDDPAAVVQDRIGGAHGALVTAVSRVAFTQALGTLRRGGTCSLVGLPPGDFPTPIFDVVLKGLTVRGSIVGTRNDLSEALAFAAAGKVKPHVELQPLDAVASIFERLRSGKVNGRVVLQVDRQVG